jgi:23S rRNA (guanosine2251-2'-O)-methyltransferase
MATDNTERIFGRNPVYEVIRADRRRIHKLTVAEGVIERGTLARLLTRASEMKIPIERVRRKELDQESDHHQGVAAVVDSYPYVRVSDIIERAQSADESLLVLLLDMLQNPQNFGTLLRSAEAVGVHGVVIPKRRGVGVTQSVVSASAGASEHLLIAPDNLVRAIEKLKAAEAWIMGLENLPQAQYLEEIDLSGAIGLVVGNEGHGMRRLVRRSCDHLIRLPMRGSIDTLNAAVAGSIALYSIWKERGYCGV